jgi:hypothetical protein
MKVIIKESNSDRKYLWFKSSCDNDFCKVKLAVSSQGLWEVDPGWRSDFLLSAEELRAIADKLDELNNIKRRK